MTGSSEARGAGPSRLPFVFVTGVARSGTTLLRVILDRHPLVAIPPESHFVPVLWRWRRRYQREGWFDLDRLARDLQTFYRFRDWGLDPTWVGERLAGERASDYSEAVRRVYGLYAEAHGKKGYGDKTPAYLSRIRLLADLFPEARFVHVIRDGRDVALSLLDRRMGHRRLSEVAEYWARRVASGRQQGLRVGPARYAEIRYEVLVRDPVLVMKEACRFLGLDFHASMVHGEGALHRLPESKRSRHQHLAEPISPGIRDWRRDMRPEQLAEFEAVAGSALEALGYERGTSEPSLSLRARARLQQSANRAYWSFNWLRTDVRLIRHRLRLHQ